MHKRQKQIPEGQLKVKLDGNEQRSYRRPMAEDKRLQDEYRLMVSKAHWLMLAFMLPVFLCMLIYSLL